MILAFASQPLTSQWLLPLPTQMTTRPAQVVTSKVARTRRTGSLEVWSLGQVLHAIVRLVGKDIGAESEKRTLARKRRRNPVRSDDVKGKINPEGRITEVICHLHRRLHRAKREITLPNTYPLHDDKGLQALRIMQAGRAKAVTGKNQDRKSRLLNRHQPMMFEA